MDFLKKHYEKIILSVVLLVVAVTAFWLTQKVSEVRQTLADQLSKKVASKKKELKPVDLANDKAALQALSQPAGVGDADRNVFNPIRWVRGADGKPKPDPRKDLATLLKLAGTAPLNLAITYLGPTGVGDPYRYQFSIAREFEKQASKRRPITVSLTEGTKNDLFLLREVHGPKDTAGEVVIELLEGGEHVTLAKDKPFTKPMGYQADLHYEIKDFAAKRVDDSVTLGGTAYKVVAIGKDEIVVSAPNGTRTTVKLSSNP